MDDMTGTMRRWMTGDERHAVTDPTSPGPGPTATVETESPRDPARRRADRIWPSDPPEGPEGQPGPGTPGAAGVGPGQEGSVDPFERDDRFINRELSWLEFGARLLDLASDPRVPLVERLKFLTIFSEGLDEFFQVRVAGLEDQVAAGLRTRSPDGLQPAQQLDAITARATDLVEWQSRIFLEQVAPALQTAGVLIADWHTLDEPDRLHLAEVFGRQIFPILTPLAVDQGHPFPYISNLSLNLVVRVENPATGEARIARVKVPPVIPRLVALPDNRRFVPVEQVIAAHLDSIFPLMTITEHHAFRVTRNADLSVEEDDAADLLAAVELELHRRRFGQAVRLEVAAGISADLLDMLIGAVDIPEHNVYLFDVPLDLHGLRSLTEGDLPELAVPAWSPVAPRGLADGPDIFADLARGDVLVHHPYESFVASVEAFITAAAEDPEVLAIKQTLYRTGIDSPVVAALIRASEAGKQVTAVVELQARFDEQANIAWARALEEAGVQVIYGLVRLKTHAKISLVVRKEGDGMRRYCHIGSGNYNSYTARTYEDVGLLTADPEVGADVSELFNLLSGSGETPTLRRLVLSPVSSRSHLIDTIEEEARAGARGRIVVKTNGLTDPAIIDALYRASQAGASIDLIVRGRCCLRPGVPGLSERIRVRSIVGRYLEHSRLFRFGGVDGRPLRVSIGSPDLMERNLDRRVEVIAPIEDPDVQRRVVRMLDDSLRDQANSWSLQPDGSWARVAPDRGPDSLGFNVQDHFQAQALASMRDHRGALRPSPSAPPSPPTAGPGAARGETERSRWWARWWRRRG
jgi:polyphosphate kinase